MQVDNMSTAVIPFDEIVPGATVRVATIGGVQYLSIRDVIMCVCDKNNHRAAETWRNIPENKKEDVQVFCLKHQFPGPGQSEQPIITLEGAIRLMPMLPGKKVQLYQKKFNDIVIRYLDGDLTLCSEVQANKTVGKDKSYFHFAKKTAQAVEGEIETKMPQVAYIYATKSPAFPDLIKIGRTNDMKTRLSQLNTGCAPLPHVVVAMAPTFNMHRDEHLAHKHFAHARREGEFFAISEQEVTDYFLNHIMAQHQKDLVQHMSWM